MKAELLELLETLNEDEIEYLNEELKKQDDVNKHQEVLMELEGKLKTISNDIDNLNQELGELNKQIKVNQEKYDKNIKLTEKNNELLKYIEYTKQVLNWVTNHRDTRELEIRKQLD